MIITLFKKNQAKVVRPADGPGSPQLAPGTGYFPHGHHSEDTKEKPQSDGRFIGQDKLVEIHGYCSSGAADCPPLAICYNNS
jgi:hypothetical protein